MNKIQQFIKDNSLDFSGYGSDLNANCVVLAGYALHLNGDVNDFDKLLEDIEENGVHDLTSEASSELERVYDFAYYNNYEDYWKTPEAKHRYKF